MGELALKQSALEAVLPLTPLQEGMLFHALYDDTGVDVYNVQTPCRLTGDVRTEVLRLACQRLLDRYACLRAGFVQRRSGQAVQAVARELKVPWEEVDLSTVDGSEREAELTRVLTRDRLRRFDVTTPPLVRFTLVRLSEREHVLVFT